jgi:hypothetical protein
MYKRGGWEIAVDAMNAQDAAKTIRFEAPGAQLQGQFTPTGWDHPSTMTAIVSERRQAEISARARKENREAGFRDDKQMD